MVRINFKETAKNLYPKIFGRRQGFFSTIGLDHSERKVDIDQHGKQKNHC